MAAVEAQGNPVTEGFASLLLNPVALRTRHPPTVASDEVLQMGERTESGTMIDRLTR